MAEIECAPEQPLYNFKYKQMHKATAETEI